MFKLKKYVLKFKKELIIGPLFKLMEAVLELIVPLVVADIVDIGVKNKDVGYVVRMGGVMLALGIAGLCFALVCQYMAAKASQGTGTIIRNDIFKRINSLPCSLSDKIGTSSLITRTLNDVYRFETGVAMLIRLALRAPFIIIGSAVMAMLIDLKLSLIFFAAAPLLAAVLYIVMSRSVPYYKKIQKKLDRISLITRENLAGVRVIRAFGKEKQETERFDKADEDFTRSANNIAKISALLNPLSYMIMYFAVVAVLWFGGMRVFEGALTQGEIITFVSYMTNISLTLVVVANLVVIFTRAAASQERISEIFEMQPEDIETDIPQMKANGKIEFKNVTFSYNKGKPALNNISFEAKAGSTIGIIGPTGSGKSTLVNLIARFYEPDSGSILLGGKNISEIPKKNLRGKIGMVSQKAALFSGTISDNIKWGNENAAEEDIGKALKAAQAYEFVEKLENKMQTQVLQGGKNFSGGQKQRLTIARALVRNPEILILDDSASALDFATDAALRKSVKNYSEGMTVFIISQRAASVMNADLILVLDDGAVTGMGTHDELLKTCGLYSEICRSQFGQEV